MSSSKVLFGFHAVGVRLKIAPDSVIEIFYESTRRDARMRQFLEKVAEQGVRLVESDGLRLSKLAGNHGHQGVAARVREVRHVHSLDELLENLDTKNAAVPVAQRFEPLILVLDGVTDPHNLGACLRVADGAGVHAVIAPKDHAAGINATVAKVASGAAETVPYFMVTNLARTLNELKERNIWIVGTSDAAPQSIYQVNLQGAVALVLGAEGDGMRQLTAKTCDQLARIPMRGAVESLNVSVASGICLYEALRQRVHSSAPTNSQQSLHRPD
jgi:23S rRNA (guanosine2251-2'-O)-methyltransferase